MILFFCQDSDVFSVAQFPDSDSHGNYTADDFNCSRRSMKLRSRDATKTMSLCHFNLVYILVADISPSWNSIF